MPPEDLPSPDDAERWIRLDRRAGLLWDLETDDPAVRRRHAREDLARVPAGPAVVVAALDGNGFVREEALARLGEADERVALPALGLRCSDFVRPVRERARALAEARLAADPPSAVRLLAPVAYGLRARRVGYGPWLADRIDDLLRADPALADVALAAGDRDARRAAYAAVADRLPFERLLAFAATDRDQLLRQRAGLLACDVARATGRVADLLPLLTAAPALVRATAVLAFERDGVLGPAVAALDDRAAIVRANAQAALRRAGIDPAPRYRALVAERPTRGAVTGLGETGTADDAALVRPLLAASRPSVRAAAVRVLSRLRAIEPAELVAMLADPASAYAAVEALRGEYVDPAVLRPLLDRERPEQVRRAAFLLLRTRDRAERVLTDLTLAADRSDPLSGIARSDLHAWLAHGAVDTYARPDEATAAALRKALARAERVLTPDQVRQVTFALGLG